MGGASEVPGPSEEEKALQREELEILREQRAITQQQLEEQRLLAPILLEQAGITPVFNDSGDIVGFETEPEDPEAAEIEQQLQERTLAALRGELPVNSLVLNDLADQESILREDLRKNLGPGFETSTPGIQALGEFGQRRSGIIDAAARGQLTTAEQLGLAREASNRAGQAQSLASITGASSFGFSGASGFQGLAAGFETLNSRLAQQRFAKFQIDEALRQQSGRNLSKTVFPGGAIVGVGPGDALFT